jgi:hypothetical protein
VQLVNLVAGIGWDIEIRALLAVATGVAILMGSIYLLLGTNVGVRLGFLVAAAGATGFLAMLCFIWWIYAPLNGPAGRAPSWEVIEANVGSLEEADLEFARALDTAGLPSPEELKEATPEEFEAIAEEHEGELSGWRLIAESDPARGEAQAAVDAYLTEGDLATELGFESSSDYIARYAFERGGKSELPDDPNMWDRISHKITSSLQITHPPRYALIQVQGVEEQETVPGGAPPTPEADPDQPVVSVILERDLGERRLPAGLAATGFTLLFGLLCLMLHRRDRFATELRALPAGGG